MKCFLVLFLSLVSGGWVSAQVQERWVARFNGPANLDDFATAIAVDAAGNVYVTGRTCNVYDPFEGCIWSDFATVMYAQQ